MTGDLGLSPKQVDSIVEAAAFLNLWEGSVRSGKTIASLLRWLGYIADPPTGGELVMVGRTRDSLARNVFGPLTNPDVFGVVAQDIRYTAAPRRRPSSAAPYTPSAPTTPRPNPN